MEQPENINAKLGVARSNRSTATVEIELKDGRLSICGLVQDTAGGYSVGQNLDTIERDAERIAAEPGGARLMPAPALARLVEIWRAWHLNDMRAGCAHQRAAWDTSKMLEFRTYSIEWDDYRALELVGDKEASALGLVPKKEGEPLSCGTHASQPMTPTQRREFEKFSAAAGALAALKACNVRPFAWVVLNARQVAFLSRSFEIIGERERADYLKQVERHRAGGSWAWKGKHRYSLSAAPRTPLLERVEKKSAAWVKPSEHPDGLLCKPCETCGYEYGTRWLREEIPAEVVAELLALSASVSDTPAPSPGDLLSGMGFSLTFSLDPTARAPKGFAPGARCYSVTLARGEHSWSGPYFMGPGLKHDPTLENVFDSLRSDANAAADEDDNELELTVAQLRACEKTRAALLLMVGEDAEALGVIR